MAWGLEPGAEIRRVELHDEYGGGRQGGIAPSRLTDNVLIFTDPSVGTQHGYDDRWVGDDYHYVGQGQVGNQTMTRGNAAILNHREDGKALRLFWGVRGVVTYSGEYKLSPSEPWYTTRARETGNERMRDVIVFRLQPEGELAPDPGRPGGPRRVVRRRLSPLTTEYRVANEAPTTAHRDPFEVDPNLVDRGLAGHAVTQNRLARIVEGYGEKPLSPASVDPDFDLAWRTADGCVVVEVKSLTAANEARQLRMGLGQVLDYADTLRQAWPHVQPALAVEREPADARWTDLCGRVGVTLLWPNRFEQFVADHRPA